MINRNSSGNRRQIRAFLRFFIHYTFWKIIANSWLDEHGCDFADINIHEYIMQDIVEVYDWIGHGLDYI
jgi:hypothetical protein